MISHLARQRHVFRARGASAAPRAFFQRPYFNRTRHSSSLALPRSLSSRLVFFLFGTITTASSFLPRLRPFFLALPWHVFRAKKSSAPNEGQKKEMRETEESIYYSGASASEWIRSDVLRCNVKCCCDNITMTVTINDNSATRHVGLSV